MRPLRILVGADVHRDPNAGAAGTVFHTNEALRELGHEVDEIWTDDLPHRIRHGNLHYLLELPRGYRDAVRERCSVKEYDVVQLSQPYAWLAARDHQLSARPGVFVNRSHGLELLADSIVPAWHHRLGVRENRFPRSLLTELLRGLLHRHTRLVGRYCDGILVPASDIAGCLMERVGMPKPKVATVAHGVQDAFVSRPPPPFTPDRQRRILYVGQYSFIKGPHILAASLEAILERHADVEATWVCGAGYHEEVRALLGPQAARRVTLLDWMPQEQLISVYDAHGLFLFTSFYEGAAKASLEAMVRGLCVVGTDVGAMRDYIDDGVNGFRVPAGDVDAFVAASTELIGDLDLCQKMSRRARASTLEYTWRRCAEGATQFYEQLLSAKANRPGPSEGDERCP